MTFNINVLNIVFIMLTMKFEQNDFDKLFTISFDHKLSLVLI